MQKNNHAEDSQSPEFSSITLLDVVLFYDGYAEVVNEHVSNSIIRVLNSKYAKKIPESFINAANSKLDMYVTVRAACDNYDFIDNVFLSLFNKGNLTTVQRLLVKLK